MVLHAREHALGLLILAVIVAAIGGGWAVLLAIIISLVVTAGLLVYADAPLREIVLFAVSATGIVVLGIALRRWRARASRAEEEIGRVSARMLRRDVALTLAQECGSGLALFELDPAGRIAGWGAAAAHLTGWSGERAVGRPVSGLCHVENGGAGEVSDHLARAAGGDGPVHDIVDVLRGDGLSFPARLVMAAARDRDGHVEGFCCALRDLSHERDQRAALDAYRKRFCSILGAVPDAMIVMDGQARIMEFNRAAEVMFGYAERDIIGHGISALMPAPQDEMRGDDILHSIATGERRVIGHARRLTARAKDGTDFPVDFSVSEIVEGAERFFLGYITDLRPVEAERERFHQLQSELFHASRVSAMGMMSATLAHELNQPLTGLVNYVEIARGQLAERRDAGAAAIADMLEKAAVEGMRAAGIVKTLREFIGAGQGERTLERLSDLIVGAMSFALAGAREDGVRVVHEFAAADAVVFVDSIQIQQVLVNLLRNAVEAMGPLGGGVLTLATAYEGRSVRVSVRDEGPGIAPGVVSHLFDPFVSTKPHGMGLGLSICRMIVEAHEGRIWARSAPGKGTDFRFTLPVEHPDPMEGEA